jgi:flagellar basal body-associated protein FliL
MADEETKETGEVKKEKTEDQPKPDGGKGQIIQWVIMAGSIMALAVVGFFAGSKMGNVPPPEKAEIAAEAPDKTAPDLTVEDTTKDSGKGWYYDLEPVATNLSDPGSTRYVRAVLTLEISPEVDKTKGTQFLDEQKPVIANILNIYFAGLTIEDINSDKDMRRIQYELLETFNDTFYKGSKPMIREILFREFGLQ